MRELAGLEAAVLMVFELTVRRAIPKVINPAASNVQKSSSALPWCRRFSMLPQGSVVTMLVQKH